MLTLSAVVRTGRDEIDQSMLGDKEKLLEKDLVCTLFTVVREKMTKSGMENPLDKGRM